MCLGEVGLILKKGVTTMAQLESSLEQAGEMHAIIPGENSDANATSILKGGVNTQILDLIKGLEK